MNETITVGYQVKTEDGNFITDEGMLCSDETLPVSLADAYKVIGAFLTSHPDGEIPRIVKVTRTREISPLEATSRELSDLLLSLTRVHGLDLGLTQDQITREITKELVALGSTKA
jgi:hypothetical protein